jgi:putative transcriptional regulator
MRTAQATPAHHPRAELLAAYASGWSPWAADLCVRVHLETCSRCRNEVAELEQAEAAFVDGLPEAPMPAGRTEALLALLAATPVETPGPAALGDVRLPSALRETALAPRRWIAPGFWVAPLRDGRRGGWRTYLLRVPAGQRLPAHGHSGPELACVLSGAFEDGERFEAGDFAEEAGRARHSPQATRDGPCACLIAVRGSLITSGLSGPLLAALTH